MKNQIITERYLTSGGGMMDEGDEAFICFKRGGHYCWIYALLVKLNERTVMVQPRYNSSADDRIRLHLNDIVKITDSDVPSEYADRLLCGEIISAPCILEIHKINDVSEIHDFLLFTSRKRGHMSYYYMDDEHSKKPQIRKLEDYEIHERMLYSFEKGSEGWAWNSNNDNFLSAEQMAQSIMDIINRDY